MNTIPAMPTSLTTSRSTPRRPLSLEEGLSHFQAELTGRNVSSLTITAYVTDLRQFFAFLRETNLAATRCDQVEREDINAYLAALAAKGRTGVTRARKLASLRAFFSALAMAGLIPNSPATSVTMPKKERRERVFLRPDEFTKLLSAAGGHARDYCILQLFLQTGIRVTELANLTLADVDLAARTLRIAGKGQKERILDLEKKATQALKNYLAQRPPSPDQHLFLNYQGAGLSDRGVKKLVEKYRVASGITKPVSCHSLRHTFGTYKAARGVSIVQIRDWMGHSSIATTQIYLHTGRSAEAKKLMEGTSL
jgi:site-specific recombinase XerD